MPLDHPPSPASLSDYLAAERTFLAWIRTGLALMGFGFVIARFAVFLQEIHQQQPPQTQAHTGLSLWFGTAVILLGVAVNLFAAWRHLHLVRQLNRGTPSHFHPSTHALLVAVVLAFIGLCMAIYLTFL